MPDPKLESADDFLTALTQELVQNGAESSKIDSFRQIAAGNSELELLAKTAIDLRGAYEEHRKTRKHADAWQDGSSFNRADGAVPGTSVIARLRGGTISAFLGGVTLMCLIWGGSTVYRPLGDTMVEDSSTVYGPPGDTMVEGNSRFYERPGDTMVEGGSAQPMVVALSDGTPSTHAAFAYPVSMLVSERADQLSRTSAYSIIVQDSSIEKISSEEWRLARSLLDQKFAEEGSVDALFVAQKLFEVPSNESGALGTQTSIVISGAQAPQPVAASSRDR